VIEWIMAFFSGILFATVLAMGGLLYRTLTKRLDILEQKIDRRNGFEQVTGLKQKKGAKR
jgi:hypothetical protein